MAVNEALDLSHEYLCIQEVVRISLSQGFNWAGRYKDGFNWFASFGSRLDCSVCYVRFFEFRDRKRSDSYSAANRIQHNKMVATLTAFRSDLVCSDGEATEFFEYAQPLL